MFCVVWSVALVAGKHGVSAVKQLTIAFNDQRRFFIPNAGSLLVRKDDAGRAVLREYDDGKEIMLEGKVKGGWFVTQIDG